jgi:arylsulfatase A-like enzyme
MRPLPPTGSHNVLLIVLDTVGADHLSLYGYDRPTSPTIVELALRGIRFDRAQATCSWTLPSHCRMFTCRWHHELSTGWLTPLDGTDPTLPEFLGSRGYATAGFIANTGYCGVDSGLNRGFAAYQDFIFPRLTVFKTAVLVDRSVDGLKEIEGLLEDWLYFDRVSPGVEFLWWLFKIDRKEAMVVNREFLDWLSRRRQPERPFFAFLNYFSAHIPYQPPEKGIHRLAVKPRTMRDANLLRDWSLLNQKGPSPHQVNFVRDSYDDCVADLDEQLGRLIDELARRPVLERTWVIITADHGREFRRTTRRVLARDESLPPAAPRSPRDHPSGGRPLATSGHRVGEPAGAGSDDRRDPGFPGGFSLSREPLARFWNVSSPTASPLAAATDPVLSEVVPRQSVGSNSSQWLNEPGWPLAALNDGDWVYIRREGDVLDELFHLREDAHERHKLAREPAMQPTLERMRGALGRLTAGPLTTERFNP